MEMKHESRDDYDSHEGLRRSSLWAIARSPLHFKWQEEHPKEYTDDLNFGIAAHKYILEKDDFFTDIIIAPDVNRRTKAGKEEWAAFVESAGSKVVITEADMQMIREMDAAIDQNPLARKLLTGQHEIPFYWTDIATGEKCKCKPDCITEFEGQKYIVDYKTTRSCEDYRFEHSVREYGYKLQAGMYCEGMFQNTFEDAGFAFVGQEKQAPYAVRVYICTEDFIREGQALFHELLDLYHDCKVNDKWPGYEGQLNMYTTLSGDFEGLND